MVSIAYLVLSVILIAKFSGAQNLKKGDTCILDESHNSGVCVSLKDCKSAQTGLLLGKRPQVCFFEGIVSIVCCDSSQEGFVSPSTNATIPSQTSRTANRRYLICPDLPPGAVKVQKTGQKAWDKCIDLAESVNPCRPSSFLSRARRIRSRECGHNVTRLVVGSAEATESEFPHMAAIGYADPKFPADISWYCDGSLISELWVLTAAHCLNQGVGRPASLVRLGERDLNVPPREDELYTVILSVKHPEYKKISKYNDIGLLKLNKEVEFSKDIRPICLHTGEPVDDDKALLSERRTSETRGEMVNLKETVEKFTLEECGETFVSRRLPQGILNTTQTCYGQRNESQDTCQDGGGHLQIYNSERVDCTYLLIGITSFGRVCGVVNIPAVYTKVSGFIPWIEQNVWPDN